MINLSVIVSLIVMHTTIIMNRFKNRGFNVSTQAMPQEVLKKIVEKRLDRLESKVQRLKNLPINAQKETIAELEQDLEEIQNLIDNGEYREAYKLKIITEQKILNKIRVGPQAHRDKGKAIKNKIKNRIKDRVKEKVKKRIKNDSDANANNDDDNTPVSVDVSSDTTVDITSNSTTVSTSTNITANNVNTSVTLGVME